MQRVSLSLFFFVWVCLLFITHLCNVALALLIGFSWVSEWLYGLTSAEQTGKILHQAEKRPECHNFSAPSYRGGAGRCAPLVETLSTHKPHAKNSHPGARLVTTGSFSLILLFLRWSHSQTRSRKNHPVPNTAWASLPLFWVASEEEYARCNAGLPLCVVGLSRRRRFGSGSASVDDSRCRRVQEK